jgi:putative dimethyl sulfoxide reductase chaperone
MVRDLENLDQGQRNLLLNWLPLLSHTFWGPSEEWCAEVCSAVAGGELVRLGEIVGAQEAPAIVAAYLEGFDRPDEICSALEEAFVRLFVNDLGGIKAPLYQSCYESEKGTLLGRPAKRMEERLKAAGWTLPEKISVPFDHLAVEVEYLTLLLEGAFEKGEESWMEGARDFAAREMYPWLSRFTDRLDQETGCPFYPAIAEVLLAVVSMIASRPGTDSVNKKASLPRDTDCT